MKRLLVLVALFCPTGVATAADLEDFEGAWAGTGAVVTDPANPSNHVLKLVGGDGPDIDTVHDILQFPIPSGTYGTFTIDIYDFGATVHDTGNPIPADSDYGPRWGIVGDAVPGGAPELSAAAGIIGKPFLDANQGYAYSLENQWTGSWFSPEFFGNPRRVKTEFPGDLPFSGDGLQLIGTGTPIAPEIPGTGAWTTWVFDIDPSGNVTITAKSNPPDSPYADDTQTTIGPGAVPMNIGTSPQLWVSGGRDTALQGFGLLGVHGVLVDNITFEGPAVVQLFGDYNDDGAVDAADYVVWRKNLNTNFDLNGNGDETGASAGTVDQADYDFWRSHFGDALTGSGGATTVPEPSSSTLLLIAALAGTIYTKARGHRTVRRLMQKG